MRVSELQDCACDLQFLELKNKFSLYTLTGVCTVSFKFKCPRKKCRGNTVFVVKKVTIKEVS